MTDLTDINKMSNLESLINPQSIAVIGASNNPKKVGFQVLKNLQEAGFAGAIYPINLKREIILGMESKASITDVGPDIDLAVIAIPAAAVKDVVLACAEKKVKSIIIISAGFAETGEEGSKLQDEIAQICQNAGIVLLGPNCFGIINTHSKINTTFSKNRPSEGPVSFFSQSGAIVASIIDWSKSANLGFGKILSLGNKALLNEAAVLEYLYNDAQTRVILGYLESLDIDTELSQILKKFAKTKPTVFIFGGKSAFGRVAAKSHTGSIVSPYVSIKTYLNQAGIVAVDTMEEFLVSARSFAKYNTITGKRMAIITNAGGPGILALDALSYHGLDLAKLTDETSRKLQENFRAEANFHNPIDILGDATDEDYAKAIEIISADVNVDGIALVLTPQSATKINETADIVSSYSGAKPLISAFVGGEFLTEAKNKLRQTHAPCFDFPEETVTALAALYKFTSKKQELEIANKTDACLFEIEKKLEILKERAFPVLDYIEVNNVDNLKIEAEKIGYPVVLKTADLTIQHKTETGGVITGITNYDELIRAFDKLGGKALIGKMIKSKLEIFLGAKKEPGVGETIAFGSGGIFAELYGDFSYRIAPLTPEMAKNMIAETKIGKILAGARGQQPYDLDKLADLIVKTSRLMQDFNNITEIDFNPILVNDAGYYIVDARIIVE
jgi:acetyltransferase